MLLEPEHALKIPKGRKWLENRPTARFFLQAAKGNSLRKRPNKPFEPLDANSWVLPVMPKGSYKTKKKWSKKSIAEHCSGMITGAAQISDVLSHSEVRDRIKAGDYPKSFGKMLKPKHGNIAAIFSKYVAFPGAQEVGAVYVNWDEFNIHSGYWLVKISKKLPLHKRISDMIRSSDPVVRVPSTVTVTVTKVSRTLILTPSERLGGGGRGGGARGTPQQFPTYSFIPSTPVCVCVCLQACPPGRLAGRQTGRRSLQEEETDAADPLRPSMHRFQNPNVLRSATFGFL